MSNRQTKYRQSGRQVAVVLTAPDALQALKSLETRLSAGSRPATKAAIEQALRQAGKLTHDR